MSKAPGAMVLIWLSYSESRRTLRSPVKLSLWMQLMRLFLSILRGIGASNNRARSVHTAGRTWVAGEAFAHPQELQLSPAPALDTARGWVRCSRAGPTAMPTAPARWHGQKELGHPCPRGGGRLTGSSARPGP